MFRAFDLRIDDHETKEDCLKGSIQLGHNLIAGEKAIINDILSELTGNGTIDGKLLTDQYFPTLHKDVFLSYSHNDQELAFSIVGILNEYFGLSVFMDSIFWGSADDLLKIIDNKYCLSKDGRTYDYDKRNFSTSHVHAMLTPAIMKAMDEAEIIVFLNTPNSVSQVSNSISNKGYDDYTLSPWIYEEILLTTMLKENSWETYRNRERIEENAFIGFEKRFDVKYKLPTEKLIPLTIEDIMKWHDEYKKRKNHNLGRYGDIFIPAHEKEIHPLNLLYELKCGVENK